MTIKDLIQELEKFPEDATVKLFASNWGLSIKWGETLPNGVYTGYANSILLTVDEMVTS